MSDKTHGTFDDLVQMANENLRPIVRGLRQLIIDINPDAYEVVRLGYRAANYGLGSTKMSAGYCHILPHTTWVNLGFDRGAHLADPKQLLEGTGKNMRHVKIHSLAEIENPAIAALIVAAVSERRVALSA